MEVRIISCHKKGLWYENRIDQIFDVVVTKNSRYAVNDNPLFIIKSKDCIILNPQPPKTYISLNILSILKGNNLSYEEIYEEYKENISQDITPVSVRNNIYHLSKKKLIEKTGISKKLKSRLPSSVWKIK